jgi:hypothetical protein
MGKDVFISYTAEDEQVAGAICSWLELKDSQCWIAPRDILPGTTYAEALIHAIDASKIMVLVFSSHANTSPHILREVERAVHNNLTIIPFRIDDSQPSDAMRYYISSSQWLDASEPPLEKHLDLLASTIHAYLTKKQEDKAQPAEVSSLPPPASISREQQGSGTPPGVSAPQPVQHPRKMLPLTIIGVIIIGIVIVFFFVHPGPSPVSLPNVTPATTTPVPQPSNSSSASPATPSTVAASSPTPSTVTASLPNTQSAELTSAVTSQALNNGACGPLAYDITQGNKMCVNGMIDDSKEESVPIRVWICDINCCNGGRIPRYGEQFSLMSDGTSNQEFSYVLDVDTTTLPVSTTLCMKTSIPGTFEHQTYDFKIVPGS